MDERSKLYSSRCVYLKLEKIFFYAFPPFILITKVLNKIKADEAEGIVVIPHWPAQPWFPLFLSMQKSEILIFKPDSKNLLSPNR